MYYDQERVRILWGLKLMQFLGPSLRKNNTKLGTKVNVYLEREKQSQQITNLKKLTNTTNIKNPEKNMFINKLPDTLL